MIDPKTTITHSQYNEDIILSALLTDIDKGFYVDIGASYPDEDSVTKLFYDKGWRGINVEPIKSVYDLIQSQRPRDININCGVGSKNSSASFREYVDVPGHSTFDTDQKNDTEQSKNFKDYTVDIKTLKDIFETNNIKYIHFLKIDVEGFEQQVVDGNDWKVYRPYVVCLEANHVKKDIQKSMLNKGYKLFIADGLNEYYIAEERWDIIDNFAERAVTLSHFSLRDHQLEAWKADIAELNRINEVFLKTHEELQSAIHKNSQLEELASLSLKNISLRSRLKRALYGVTIDWLNYKKQSRSKD